MKAKQHAKDRREAGKLDWRKNASQSISTGAEPALTLVPKLSKEQRARIEAEEAQEFLQYGINSTPAMK